MRKKKEGVCELSNLRITPIGTCRIHTPLKRAVARYPIELDLRRNYGFVHTSGEVLQLIRYMAGEKEFRPEVLPLIMRGADIAKTPAEVWHPTDFHIVEISSAKVIRSGADIVQSNYISHYFSDFFANAERTRTFWTLVRLGHRRDVLEFVRDQSAYRRLPRADRELLMSLSLEQQSPKALQADMAEIVDRLGQDRVLFVTHVNAVTPDDSLIPARNRLIRLVKSTAEELRVPVFDPTQIMRQFGQERALENGGLDLTHYTAAFSDAVYDALHEEHIDRSASKAANSDLAPARDPATDAAFVAAKLAGALETEDFESAARSIHEALDQFPDCAGLIELRGLVRARIGDFAGAKPDLARRGDDTQLSHAHRIWLLEALFNCGEEEAALKVAENLIGDEYEGANIYRIASAAAEKLGRMAEAILYAKQAFRFDRTDLPSALKALRLLGGYGKADAISEWRGEILESLFHSSTAAFEVGLWAVENRDDTLFAAAVRAIGTSDKIGTIELLERASDSGMVCGVAESIDIAATLGRLDRTVSQRRAAIVAWLYEEALRLFEQGQPDVAYRAAVALANLEDGKDSQFRVGNFARRAGRLMRLIERNMRIAIRDAFKRGDSDEVVRLGKEATQVLHCEPDAAVLVARSLQSIDQAQDALELLRSVQRLNPNHFGVRRWTARSAAQAGDYATALNLYGELDRTDPRLAHANAEADRFFATAERRGLKQLRVLLDADRDDEAFELISALRAHTNAGVACDRELSRKHRNLRARLIEIEQGEGDLDDREAILRLMLRIKPGDTSALRRLALDCMRQLRFAEAAEIWDALRALSPDDRAAERKRERCDILAKRARATFLKAAA
jgi:tetratricopeptide (TPR) repeat protein